MKYKVLSPIRYGGKRIEVGEFIELNKNEAQPLLDGKLIEAAASEKAEEETKHKKAKE